MVPHKVVNFEETLNQICVLFELPTLKNEWVYDKHDNLHFFTW